MRAVGLYLLTPFLFDSFIRLWVHNPRFVWNAQQTINWLMVCIYNPINTHINKKIPWKKKNPQANHFILGSNCIFTTELTKFCYSKMSSNANEALGHSWQSYLPVRLVSGISGSVKAGLEVWGHQIWASGKGCHHSRSPSEFFLGT